MGKQRFIWAGFYCIFTTKLKILTVFLSSKKSQRGYLGVSTASNKINQSNFGGTFHGTFATSRGPWLAKEHSLSLILKLKTYAQLNPAFWTLHYYSNLNRSFLNKPLIYPANATAVIKLDLSPLSDSIYPPPRAKFHFTPTSKMAAE